MAKVNKSRLIEFIAGRTTVYMPIAEAIVNSIDAIEERKIKNGEIRVELIRNPIFIKADSDDTIAPVTTIRVRDNGSGFNDRNRNSFDTLFSEQKVNAGGKGFGRLIYLKYFSSTKIKSNYQDNKLWKERSFIFTDGEEFISSEANEESRKKEFETVVELSDIRQPYRGRLNKRVDTIARRLFEMLLPYFVVDGYKPPRITIVDEDEREEVILNEYLDNQDKISLIYDETLRLEDSDNSDFKVKIFKIYHSKAKSSIALTANHRQVTTTPLHNYVPEFIDDFNDPKKENDDQGGNYIIKSYVIGKYLDQNVSIERSAFMFNDEDETKMYPLSKKHIESEVAELVRSKFSNELTPRKNKKVNRIKEYVDMNAPWNKFLLKELDYDTIPFNVSDKEIDSALNKIAFDKEQTVKASVAKVLKTNNADEINKHVNEITEQVIELGRGNLAHYVALRRVILDIFAKSLKLKETNRHELENIIHKIVFPLKKNTDSISYEDHNLWLLDEKLSFSEYVASDTPLNTGDERPDLLSFDRPIAIREGDELSNPITIFEFKRPGRIDYKDTENPLSQVSGYVAKIRGGNYKNPQGRPVRANDNTPAYGFIVCDITKRIREFCELYQLTLSPDGDAYYGFHSKYKIYFEVVSFDKVIRDSEQRNKVFFRKLGISN